MSLSELYGIFSWLEMFDKFALHIVTCSTWVHELARILQTLMILIRDCVATSAIYCCNVDHRSALPSPTPDNERTAGYVIDQVKRVSVPGRSEA